MLTACRRPPPFTPAPTRSASAPAVFGNGSPLVRDERKFTLAAAAAPEVRRRLRDGLCPDPHAGVDGCYVVRNLYFDTPDLRLYRDTAAGRPVRSKVRLRRYEPAGGPPSSWFLEVKIKANQACVKPARLELPAGAVDPSRVPLRLRELPVDSDGVEALRRFAPVWVLDLEPSALVVYRREALVHPARADVRVTLDTELSAMHAAHPLEPLERAEALGAEAVLEVKFDRTVPPEAAAVMRLAGVRSGAASKYCRAIEATHPLFCGAWAAAAADCALADAACGASVFLDPPRLDGGGPDDDWDDD
jgi:hypothetical protein